MGGVCSSLYALFEFSEKELWIRIDSDAYAAIKLRVEVIW